MKKFIIGAALIGLFASVGTGIASDKYGKRRDAGRNRTSSNGCFTCCKKDRVKPSCCSKKRSWRKLFDNCCNKYNGNQKRRAANS